MAWKVETSFVFLIPLHRHTLHTYNNSVYRMNDRMNEVRNSGYVDSLRVSITAWLLELVAKWAFLVEAPRLFEKVMYNCELTVSTGGKVLPSCCLLTFCCVWPNRCVSHTVNLLSKKDHLLDSCFRGEEASVQREQVTFPKPQGCSAGALERETETQASWLPGWSSVHFSDSCCACISLREALSPNTCVHVEPLLSLCKRSA